LAKQAATAKKNRHVQPDPGPERAFGDALREIRKEKGLSQEQLALDSDLDRTYVSLIERGAQSPTIRSVIKVANVLGVKPSDIMLRMETLLKKFRAPARKAGTHGPVKFPERFLDRMERAGGSYSVHN
jgi:transcriptional regulator with XRE-family HTH domain